MSTQFITRSLEPGTRKVRKSIYLTNLLIYNVIGFKTIDKCISQFQITTFRRDIPSLIASKTKMTPLLIAYNHTEKSRIENLMNWKHGDQFQYYDFWRNGINKIASEDINNDSTIYLTSQKCAELKWIGLFHGSPPVDVRFPYLSCDGSIKSQKDVCFLYNQICIILNNCL